MSPLMRKYSGGVPYAMTLTSTGDGTGVSTLKMTVSEDVLVSLGPNAKFYSDAGGSADESGFWTILSGAARTIYLKCTTATATMTFSDITKVTSWIEWTSSTNAASIGGDIGEFVNLTYLYVKGSNTISGSVAALTSLTYLLVKGSNTLSGSVAALTSLTYLNVTGSNTLSGDINPLVSDLTTCTVLGDNQMEVYTSGATWGNATVTINPAVGYGYSETEVDNILIDMAASDSMSGKIITLQGSSLARTSASDAAVAKLETLNSGYVHAANTVNTTP